MSEGVQESFTEGIAFHLWREGMGWVCQVDNLGRVFQAERTSCAKAKGWDSVWHVLELEIAECYGSINCEK